MSLILENAGTIDRMFKTSPAIQRHREAPLFVAREIYLRQLLNEGRSRKSVSETAALLLHVVSSLNLSSPRNVSRSEIQQAARSWAEEVLAHRPNPRKKSAARFYTAAVGFLRFHELIKTPDPLANKFDLAFIGYQRHLSKSGYLPTTLSTLLRPLKAFLFWVAQQRSSMSSISYRDVQAFLKEGRARGLKPRTIVNQCQALRSFFRFAETQGWCTSGLSQTIANPIVRSVDWEIVGPTWKEVRRMISLIDDSGRANCRAKAIILLCALYGLRHSEIRGLTLESFDWRSQTFAVKRAKQERLQLFPIHQELGEAIIQYLKQGRPACACRSLFLTLYPPYRALTNLATVVTKQMKAAGIESPKYGPHSLRHAFATELLRKGTPLQSIADLLGHRDIRSVSIYAKYDLRSLRQVAVFSLAGLT